MKIKITLEQFVLLHRIIAGNIHFSELGGKQLETHKELQEVFGYNKYLEIKKLL